MKKLIILLVALAFSHTFIAQEKETPPQGGTPKGFTLPKKEVIELDNGLKLVLIPYGAIPKATINISIKTGNIHEKENETWLSDLTVDLMKEGSQTLSSKDISNKMAGMGGNLNMGVTPHTTNLSTSVLSNFSDDAITLMSDVLLHPKWPEGELTRLKNDRKRNLEISLSQPQSQASRDFYATIYPNHAYGRIYPKAEQIDGYSIENIKNFYNTNFGAQRTTIYVVGKFNKSEVEKAVRTAFKDWKKGPEESYPIATAATDGVVKIVDRPGAPQSTILYGLPVVDPSNPDYTALDVTNSILGGSFGSRITSNIREDKGYTYSPSSNIDTNYKSGVWYESAAVTTEFTGASLSEINKEIYRLQNEAPTKEELDGIKNYESGLFVLQNSTPNGIIGQLNFLDVHDLNDDYLKNRVQDILAVTPEQVQEMTKKYIKPENMTLIVVGDKEKIENQVNETIQKKEKLKQ